MKKSTTVIILAITVLLARPQAVLAQTTPAPTIGSWESLKAIPPGDKLAVELRNGQTVKGRLSAVSDTSLTLADGRKVTDVSRGDVLKVRRKISKSAKRATMIGIGVGGGVGLAGSVVAAGGYEADLLALIGGAIGAGAGALIGYLVGSRKQWALIYETKAP
jgi:small nuclear ribonucleoprotein (snRNP)-like protein